MSADPERNSMLPGFFGRNKAASEELAEHVRRSGGAGMVRRFRKNKLAMFGLSILTILVVCAAFADFIAPNNPTPLLCSLRAASWE